MADQENIVGLLVKEGIRLLNEPYEKSFTNNMEADNLINDLAKRPHAFVLGCVMDTQIPAEKAWMIPFRISVEIGGFEFGRLLNLTEEELIRIFNEKRFHRFNEKMAKNFYFAVRLIHDKYDDDASKIWNDNPPSEEIIRRFREFKGIGQKVSTMATNILLRRFKLPLKDKKSIDISVDVHIRRIFKRIGIINADASDEEIIIYARSLYPDYPGVFDLPTWKIGKEWCNETNPECQKCYLNQYCAKILTKN